MAAKNGEAITGADRIKVTTKSTEAYDLVKHFFNYASDKDKVLVDLRSKNLNYAILSFGALFTLGINYATSAKEPLPLGGRYVAAAAIAAVQFLLMTIFCIWDRRLHRMNHSWRYRQRYFFAKFGELLRNGEAEIERAAPNRGTRAEFWSLQPVLYYCLMLCSLAFLATALILNRKA